MQHNNFYSAISEILTDYPLDLNESDYIRYMIAFQFLCAYRAHFQHEDYKQNEKSNQNDLLDDGVINRLQDVLRLIF